MSLNRTYCNLKLGPTLWILCHWPPPPSPPIRWRERGRIPSSFREDGLHRLSFADQFHSSGRASERGSLWLAANHQPSVHHLNPPCSYNRAPITLLSFSVNPLWHFIKQKAGSPFLLVKISSNTRQTLSNRRFLHGSWYLRPNHGIRHQLKATKEIMTDLVARTGRLQQRYKAGCRLVAGCIPFKYRNSDGSCDSEPEKIEVLMINSQNGPGLLFPKGGWENDETVEEAAAREALEEAGVRGEIMNLTNDICSIRNITMRDGEMVKLIHPPLGYLGDYDFKSKTLQDEFSPDGLCKAAIFSLFVKEELPSWPEQSTRQRRWLTIREAVENCRYPWMQKALEEGFTKWHAKMISHNLEEH